MSEAFIYLWYDAGWRQTEGSRYYIGKHKGEVNSGYVCSSKYMMPEWRERGCKHKGCTHLFGEEGHHGDFHRRILAYGTDQEMFRLEKKLLKKREDQLGNRYYNRIISYYNYSSQWHDSKITLFKYEIYLNKENMLEIETSLLEQEDWDRAIAGLKEYKEATTMSNFLAYLKKLMVSINSGVTTYF
tara:strand:- start:1031 stop:1588 length:558 start_codon:yes stop_codon:yes gene_type:complete